MYFLNIATRVRARKQDMKNFSTIRDFADNFLSRKCHNLPYPPGIHQSIVDQVSDVVMWQAATTFNDDKISLLISLNL